HEPPSASCLAPTDAFTAGYGRLQPSASGHPICSVGRAEARNEPPVRRTSVEKKSMRSNGSVRFKKFVNTVTKTIGKKTLAWMVGVLCVAVVIGAARQASQTANAAANPAVTSTPVAQASAKRMATNGSADAMLVKATSG